MHRFAPQPTLPEFYVEVGYMTDFTMRWKLRVAQVYEIDGKLDIPFLARWQVHRQPLVKFCQARFDPRRMIPTVRRCLEFMDALIADWQRELTGEKPDRPLSLARLEELQEHRRKLESIPGEKWEIKY